MNTQPISKNEMFRTGELEKHPLQVNEIFETIQGEGPYTGRPAIFIRLAGCSLQCFWCDTEYSCSEELTVREIRDRVLRFDLANIVNSLYRPLVVITGGEPFRQDIRKLIQTLALRFTVQIETNGINLPEKYDWGFATMVCSPKTSRVHPVIATACSHWKYIIKAGEVDPRDGLPIFSTQHEGKKNKLFRPRLGSTVWVSPLDEKDPEKNKANTEAAVDSVMKYGYRLSLQTHKILGLP